MCSTNGEGMRFVGLVKSSPLGCLSFIFLFSSRFSFFRAAPFHTVDFEDWMPCEGQQAPE